MTSLLMIVLYEHVTAYRIESNRKTYQLIESMKFHINDITSYHWVFVQSDAGRRPGDWCRN